MNYRDYLDYLRELAFDDFEKYWDENQDVLTDANKDAYKNAYSHAYVSAYITYHYGRDMSNTLAPKITNWNTISEHYVVLC